MNFKLLGMLNLQIATKYGFLSYKLVGNSEMHVGHLSIPNLVEQIAMGDSFLVDPAC